MFLEGGIFLRRTPFDVPLLLFIAIVLISSTIAPNRADALINSTSALLAVLFFVLMVNHGKSHTTLLYLTGAFLIGASVLAILTVLSYFKIYVIPIELTRSQLFSPLGSLYDQAMYLVVGFLVALQTFWTFLTKHLKKRPTKLDERMILFGVAAIVIVVGLLFTAYELIYLQKPVFLPIAVAFQTAFATISQDAGRLVQSFLFGSGYGTYVNDFTRFKPVSFNLNQALWSYTFFRSSSFVLEILATVGTLGLLSFLFLLIRIVRELKKAVSKENKLLPNPFFIALTALVVGLFVIPFSFIGILLFFIILSLFSIYQGLSMENKRFYDMQLYVVAFEQGIIAFSHTKTNADGEPKLNREKSRILPFLLLIIILGFIGGFGYLAGIYVTSDILFQKSLIAAAQNKGSETYDYENKALKMFPYRDGYYRIFSQTNLALASLLSSQQQGKKPNTQTQQTIYTLIQQSINSARSATLLSPQSALNWQNLSSIYRSLIGFGQNAEQFSILANQQAVLLDPSNPQEYINLGGIYYQLNQWDEALRQFQLAISLKPDYPNSYYNYGHALEQKNDLTGALSQYKTVKNLVSNDPAALQKINEEIKDLQDKINNNAQTNNTAVGTEQQVDTSLGISQPQTKLPQEKPPVKIPGVTITPTPTK